MNREKKKIDLLIKTLAIVGLLVVWTLYSRANGVPDSGCNMEQIY